jgi:hypothetical protein
MSLFKPFKFDFFAETSSISFSLKPTLISATTAKTQRAEFFFVVNPAKGLTKLYN